MKIGWYVKRLQAMSSDEVSWRLAQKRLCADEKKVFGKLKLPVTDGVYYPELDRLTLHPDRLPIGVGAKAQELSGPAMTLIGPFDYESCKTSWHAGFQTGNDWPLSYSASMDYRQRDEVGDARTNWELNRHFQFAALAARYYFTGDIAHLEELGGLFTDWNDKNPFLWGISWTSAMEVAIRSINWMYALGFLYASYLKIINPVLECDSSDAACDSHGGESSDTTGTADDGELSDAAELLSALMDSLSCGIINMTSYVANHFSRFSSANNHTIIEACAICCGGLLTDYEPWWELGFDLLNEELQNQTYPEGVNKELSLHYQSFVMEGIGLLSHVMICNGMNIPQLWRSYMTRMSRYILHCRDVSGGTVVFGDDDEGRILDLSGRKGDHYSYVLQLMSLILPERYVAEVSDVTLRLIADRVQLESVSSKPLYEPKSGLSLYNEAGISLFRSGDGRLVGAFDHGPLGYGSLAAHGHADALSFRLMTDGVTVLGDPGTYIYHIERRMRDLFRKTCMHSTLCLCGRDQSVMVGAFQWGRRAECTLLKYSDSDEGIFVEAEHNGYFPFFHRRRVAFDGNDSFVIRDRLINIKGREKPLPYEIAFVMGPQIELEMDERQGQCLLMYEGRLLCRLKPEASGGSDIFLSVVDIPYSTAYGSRVCAKKLVIKGNAGGDTEVITRIKVTYK